MAISKTTYENILSNPSETCTRTGEHRQGFNVLAYKFFRGLAKLRRWSRIASNERAMLGGARKKIGKRERFRTRVQGKHKDL